jgi:hypothetical protein
LNGLCATLFWFEQFPIPFGIVEMNVGPDEVIDSEVIFAVVKPGAAATITRLEDYKHPTSENTQRSG